jgi:hypothetical protein
VLVEGVKAKNESARIKWMVGADPHQQDRYLGQNRREKAGDLVTVTIVSAQTWVLKARSYNRPKLQRQRLLRCSKQINSRQ